MHSFRAGCSCAQQHVPGSLDPTSDIPGAAAAGQCQHPGAAAIAAQCVAAASTIATQKRLACSPARFVRHCAGEPDQHQHRQAQRAALSPALPPGPARGRATGARVVLPRPRLHVLDASRPMQVLVCFSPSLPVHICTTGATGSFLLQILTSSIQC